MRVTEPNYTKHRNNRKFFEEILHTISWKSGNLFIRWWTVTNQLNFIHTSRSFKLVKNAWPDWLSWSHNQHFGPYRKHVRLLQRQRFTLIWSNSMRITMFLHQTAYCSRRILCCLRRFVWLQNKRTSSALVIIRDTLDRRIPVTDITEAWCKICFTGISGSDYSPSCFP